MGCRNTTILVWDVSSNEVKVLKGHTSSVDCVQFSPDGQQVVSGSMDRTVRIWDLAKGKSKKVLQGHEKAVTCVQFSPDGQRIVSGSYDYTVRVWKLVRGKAIVLRGHEKLVTSVQFSTDAERVVSGSEDRTIRMWDIRQKRMIQCITFHTSVISFSLNDRTGLLCVGFEDGGVQCWQMMGELGQSLQLKWSSSRYSSVLFLSGCDIRGAIGLSGQNERLLTQRGAIAAEGTANVKATVLGGLKKVGTIFKKKSTSKRGDEIDESRKHEGKNKDSSMLEASSFPDVDIDSEHLATPSSVIASKYQPELEKAKLSTSSSTSWTHVKIPTNSPREHSGEKSVKIGNIRNQSPRRKNAETELIEAAPVVQETRRFKPAPPAPPKTKKHPRCG